jgi:ABC-2 type transport system permease protein
MHLDVVRREMADHRRSSIACAVGAVLLVMLYIFFFPTIKTSGASVQQLLNSMPKGLRATFMGQGVNYLSPPGYLGTEFFSALLPVLLMVMGILAGGRALAGEEQNGTIDLVLSTPIPRRRLAAEKAVGALLPLFLVVAALWVVIMVIGPTQQVKVSAGALAVALVAVALLGSTFGMLAFLVASATGSAALGGGVAAAVAVVMYALNLFGALVTGVTGFANAVSPFHWDGGAGVLVNGVPGFGILLLVVCPIVLLGLSLVAYDRRDLTA